MLTSGEGGLISRLVRVVCEGRRGGCGRCSCEFGGGFVVVVVAVAHESLELRARERRELTPSSLGRLDGRGSDSALQSDAVEGLLCALLEMCVVS